MIKAADLHDRNLRTSVAQIIEGDEVNVKANMEAAGIERLEAEARNDSQGGETRAIRMEPVDSETFIAARDKSSRPEYLSFYSDEELAEMRLYKAAGQDVGYALKPDGELVNVFNNSGIRGAGKEAIIHAIANGAKKLDCFDGHLADKVYPVLGFREVKRIPWSDEFAPPNWNYVKEGRPDVVYFEYPEGLSRDPNEVRARVEAAQNGRLQEPGTNGERPSPARPQTLAGAADDAGTGLRAARGGGHPGDSGGKGGVSGSDAIPGGGSRGGLDTSEQRPAVERVGLDTELLISTQEINFDVPANVSPELPPLAPEPAAAPASYHAPARIEAAMRELEDMASKGELTQDEFLLLREEREAAAEDLESGHGVTDMFDCIKRGE
jgi:hypothetical protein